MLGFFLVYFSTAVYAVQFEDPYRAVAKILKTQKAILKKVQFGSETLQVFFAKENASPLMAVIQKGTYEPNCTHTWVIGVNRETSEVTEIRVSEMSCPHAFPTKKASFLDQYKGKGPADLKKLSSDIVTLAKATGSSNLTTDAVKKSIEVAKLLKGK